MIGGDLNSVVKKKKKKKKKKTIRATVPQLEI
jgi:hypothetical protein